MKAKLGRNDPCHCKSGKKYKRCHLEIDRIARNVRDNPDFLKEPLQAIHRKQRGYVEFQKKYGRGKEIISTEWQGKRVVAVGSTVHLSPINETKTFHDFLSNYIKSEFNSNWGNVELKKPLAERHILLQWYDSVCKLQRKNLIPSPDGIYSAIMNGSAGAYYNLAYQLFLISHNNLKLRDELWKRLRDPLKFQSARYELFVAATFIRAGFEIAFEDESDRTKKHPEFIATHMITKQSFAVEAKSRHHKGLLGQPGRPLDPKKIKAKRIGQRLHEAFNKAPSLPYIIFLDVHFPPEEQFGDEKTKWMKKVETSQALKRKADEEDPFNMIVFTNQPHHFGAEEEPDPRFEAFRVIAEKPKIQMTNSRLLEDIWDVVSLYGKIPKDFPRE